MAQPTQRSRRIVVMMIASSLAAIAALFGTVWWLSNAANRLAADQSRQLVEVELKAVSAELSTIIRHTGRWDKTHEWVTNRETQQIIDNIGSGAGPRGPFNFLYIINSIGTPLFAFEGKELLPGAIGYNLELVNVVRSELQGLPLEPYTTVSGYVSTIGRIAMVTAGRIQRIDGSEQNVDTTPILIGARWFSQADLDGIGHRLQLSGMRLDYWDSVPRDGTLSVPLLDISGRAIAHVSWWPPRPGDMLLDRVKPLIILIAIIMFLCSFAVGHAAARQTDALIREMQMARTDNLTGLLNRTGLEQAVDTARFQKALTQGALALVYLDINDFKPLNDTFGHNAGDRALETVAERLRGACRQTDMVARLGGDEFLCVVLDSRPEDAIARVTGNIREAMSKPIDFGDHERIITVSLGHVVATKDAVWNDLVFEADEAMYRDKGRHRASASAA